VRKCLGSLIDSADRHVVLTNEFNHTPSASAELNNALDHRYVDVAGAEIAGRGVAAVTVSIDNAPFKGVLPLPASALKSASPVLSNPANAKRGVALTFEQFQYGWANALDEVEAKQLYDGFHVPAAGAPLFQAAFANFNPFGGETAVDSKNPERGPMLIIGGEKDHTVPPAITDASYKIQSRNPGTTEEITIPGRGHSLTIDSGWREVADEALVFVQRFIQ
jgi:non-heme chloroperoxidase